MIKTKIAIFFSFLFILFITVPTVVILVDDSIDISFLYNSSEEEEQDHEMDENVKIFIAQENTTKLEFLNIRLEKSSGFFNPNYPKHYLNTVFPPPQAA